MATSQDETTFNRELCARVQRIRKGLNLTAEQMAMVLGIPAERYRKYESRSPLPAYLMERFCLVAHIDLPQLLTGKASTSKKFKKLDISSLT